MSDAKPLDDGKSTDNHLPHTRIKTIMKSSADPVSLNINNEALQVVCRATEMFIQLLAKKSHDACERAKLVEYQHLARIVQDDKRMEFIHQIVPKKITVKQFREIMEKQKARDNNTSGSSSESSSDDEDDDEEEEEQEEEEEEVDDDIEDDVKKGSTKSAGKKADDDAAVSDAESASSDVVSVKSSSVEFISDTEAKK